MADFVEVDLILFLFQFAGKREKVIKLVLIDMASYGAGDNFNFM